MRKLLSLVALASLAWSACPAEVSSSCTYSPLWGVSGEKWNPASRLPDFSYAGYHAGEANLPNAPAKWDFKRDFHAKGDGHTDDSGALLNAIQTIEAGVLFIPEGTYVIARRIDIAKGNFVLRGAGPSKTILLFPNSLADLFGNKAKGTEQSEWAFRPGLLNITGKDPINARTLLASVTAPAKRGDRILHLASKITVAKGQWIRLTESDPKNDSAAGSLVHYLYGNLMPPGSDLIGTPHIVRFLRESNLFRVTRLNLRERCLMTCVPTGRLKSIDSPPRSRNLASNIFRFTFPGRPIPAISKRMDTTPSFSRMSLSAGPTILKFKMPTSESI
jgi:hypothetical protein